MIALNAHFDGKVIVPDEPVDLLPNQKIRIQIEAVESKSEPQPVDFRKLVGLGLPLPTDHQPRFSNDADLWDRKD